MARTATFNRDAVLERARDLFWSKGYRGTSLKDLEAAIDLRPGSIYAAFGSKEGLYAEALKLYAGQGREAAAAVFSEHASPLAGLAAYARSFAALCDGQGTRACMLAKTVLEMADDDPVLRDLADTYMAEVEDGFEAQFRAAQTAGELAPEADPKRLARRMQAGVIGLRAYAQRRVDPDAVRDLAEDFARQIEALRF